MGTSRKGPSRFRWVGPVGLAVAIGAGTTIAWMGERDTAPVTPDTAVSVAGVTAARRETRPVLDPARFVGKAAVTHQIAHEMPDVLDHLYCYCQCDKSVGHKSLLSCFTDGHAAT